MEQSNMRLKLDSLTHSIDEGDHEESIETNQGMMQETGVGGSNITDRFYTLEPKHTVFLSHSGTQKGFVNQLCVDFESWHRYPFFDRRRSSLPIGEEASKCIFKAIEQCQVGVLVLSKEFFTRTKWPMLELVAMVREYKKPNPSIKIYPVFYFISYEEWEKSINCIEWIKQWDNWALEDKSINVEEWKEALETLREINGFVMDKDEVKCRKMIVEDVCDVVLPESEYDDAHVQGKLRLCEIICKKMNGVEQRNGIQVMGLHGFGGIGKSTICKALCNELSEKFKGRVCHVELKSASEMEVLHGVLRKLTNIRHELLMSLSIHECLKKLRECIQKRSIFLAIDNMSDDLEARRQAVTYLRACLGEGSVVIVTARSLGELMYLHQYIDECNCLEMPELEDEEARHLFLDHVTCGCDAGIEMDGRLISHCLQRCYFSKGEGKGHHYIPLALKVLGELLGCLGYNAEKWEEHLNNIDIFTRKLSKDNHPIFSILRTSFNTFSDEVQMLFMDVALFHPHVSWKCIDYYYELYEWLSVVHGSSVPELIVQLEALKKKSLLEDFGNGQTKIRMHELWRDFCKAEAKVEGFEDRRWLFLAEASSELGESSGCWHKMKRMCFSNEGWKSLNGLQFEDFKNVSVLKVEVGSFVVPSELKLDLTGLQHLKSLELNTDQFITRCVGLGSLKNLVFLLWKSAEATSPCIGEIGFLTKLQVLDIDNFQGDKLPDLSRLTSLRVVSFKNCLNVTTIMGLSSKLTNLWSLSLRRCWSLREFPGLNEVSALVRLCFNGCSKLEELPCLRLLTKLRALIICECELLRAVPRLSELVTLEGLLVQDCSRLETLPDMWKLTQLEVLRCDQCSALKSLTCSRPLGALREINLTLCRSLNEMPDLSNFPQLEVLRLGGCTGLMSLTSSVPLYALKILDLEACSSLSALPGYLSSSSNLQELRLQKSSIVLDGEETRELLGKCSRLVVFPNSGMSKYGDEGGYATNVSGLDGREDELDGMEIYAQSQCRSRRLPNSFARDCKVARIAYTKFGGSLLALASNGMHKLWDWGHVNSDHTTEFKATTSFAPKLWRPASGLLMINDICETNSGEVVSCMAVSKNDAYVISASGGKVLGFQIRNSETNPVFLPPPSRATSLAFYPHNNNIMIIGMEDSTIQIYDSRMKEAFCVLKGHLKKITSLAFSTSLRMLVSLGADAQLCMWRTEGWMKQQSYFVQPDGRSPCVGDTCIQFHKDEVRLLVVGKSQLAVYDASSRLDCLCQWEKRPLTAAISDATFSCDGQLVYVSFLDGSVDVFDAESFSPRWRLAPPIHKPWEVNGSAAYPLTIAANPAVPNQFAMGMSDGDVLVVEPLESEGQWWQLASADNGPVSGDPSRPAILQDDARADEIEEPRILEPSGHEVLQDDSGADESEEEPRILEPSGPEVLQDDSGADESEVEPRILEPSGPEVLQDDSGADESEEEPRILEPSGPEVLQDDSGADESEVEPRILEPSGPEVLQDDSGADESEEEPRILEPSGPEVLQDDSGADESEEEPRILEPKVARCGCLDYFCSFFFILHLWRA